MLKITWLFIVNSVYLTLASTTTNESALIQSLLSGYESRARPKVSTDQVDVTLSMNMLKLHLIDTRLQHISVIGWVTAKWTDLRLTWNVSDYGGVDTVALLPGDVWLPSFVLGNSATGTLYSQAWGSLYKVLVSNDGSVSWFPGGQFEADCQIEVTYFPFDEQICEFVFKNWIYTSDKVNLTFEADAEDTFLDYYTVPNGEWDVKAIKIIRRDLHLESGQVFPEVHIGLHCKRKPLFFVINIVLLSVLLAVLVLIMFKLPPESGERVSMGVTLLLAFSVFILMIDSSIPETSQNVPLVIVYLVLFMAMTTLGIAESVLVLYCYHHPGDHRPPKWVRVIVLRVIGGCLCEGKHHNKIIPHEANTNESIEKNTKSTNESNDPEMKKKVDGNLLSESIDKCGGVSTEDMVEEWRDISTLIDKFSFWLFLGMFLFIMLVLLIIMPYSQPGKNLNDTKVWAGF